MDPISNMIIMLKNAGLAGKESVVLPYSNIKNAIAVCLEKEGYVKKITKKARKSQNVLEIELVYVAKKPRIADVERISKNSRRVYFSVKDIHPIRNGSGILILSTPKGIMSGKEAKKENVGGEALFQIF